MGTMTVQATYVGGVLKPASTLDLPEGSAVEVQIRTAQRSAAVPPSTLASLAGIWSYLSDDELSKMEEALKTTRDRLAGKLETMTRELSEGVKDHSG